MMTATIMLVVIATVVTLLVMGVQKAKAKKSTENINIDTPGEFVAIKMEEQTTTPTTVEKPVKTRKPRTKKTDATSKKTKAAKKSK